MRRAAIYARVSTVDRGQDPETQLRQLRAYAERRGFSLAHEYVDHASGATNDRAEYRAMLEAARRRRFDVLLVWRYDRFARSMRELVNALAEFEGLGIDFVSYNEGADTTTPQGELVFGIFQLPTSSTSRRGGYSCGFDLRLDPIRLDHVGALKRLSTEEHDLEDSQQAVDATGKDVGNCKRLTATLRAGCRG